MTPTERLEPSETEKTVPVPTQPKLRHKYDDDYICIRCKTSQEVEGSEDDPGCVPDGHRRSKKGKTVKVRHQMGGIKYMKKRDGAIARAKAMRLPESTFLRKKPKDAKAELMECFGQIDKLITLANTPITLGNCDAILPQLVRRWCKMKHIKGAQRAAMLRMLRIESVSIKEELRAAEKEAAQKLAHGIIPQ